MPDFRQDPVTGRWVIIAANRANRPLEFSRPEIRDPNQICPFCHGNESLTPNEVARFGGDGSSPTDWLVRVVPNLYPALTDNLVDFPKPGTGFYASKPATGLHEVIIESPRHDRSLTQLPTAHMQTVLVAYRSRFRHIDSMGRFKSALLFKNNGVAAGVSLEHVHSQFTAFSFIPPVIQEELDGAQRWKSKAGECIYCHLVDEELKSEQRLIAQTDGFVAFCPYASRFAHESWILPKLHQPHFHQMGDSQLGELAELYHRILSKLESTFRNVAYNCLFHSSPFDSSCYDHYHWHIEIIPRTATIAGLEWGSGVHVNVVEPEQSALLLRS